MKKTGLIICCFLLCASRLLAQDAVSADLLERFKQYRTTALTEKLYVHTDKSFYVAGEICWFKIYATDGSFHQPLDLSKVVYAEIVSADHKAVLQAKIEMQDASGTGSFVIPFTIQTGNYVLRAYTNWMKNFSPAYFFEKQITIVNTLKQPAWNELDTSTKMHATFFPEGGKLVAGLPTSIAFKINDDYGKGIAAAGTIIDGDSNTVASFTTFHNGMGKLSFTPAKGGHYRAVIITHTNDTIYARLPRVYDEGYVMHLASQNNQQLTISINSNKNSSDQLYLFIHTRNIIKAVLPAKLQNNKAEFTIDKNQLGDGISQFTLFDKNRNPICERLYFKRPQEKLTFDIKSDAPVYDRRKKVTLDIIATNESHPVMTDASVAVLLIDSLQRVPNMDIRSYLWLRSDLKGFIEDPGYYFDDTTARCDEAADNLMLTQGWRRFEWIDVLKNNEPSFKFLPEADGHIINGKLINQKTGAVAAGINASVSVVGQPFRFKSDHSDAAGNLQFDMRDFFGTGEIVVQTNNRADSNYRIDIANPFSGNYAEVSIARFTLPVTWRSYLNKRSMSSQVQQVYNASHMNRFYDYGISDTSAFYGQAARTYLLDDYTRFVTMEEVIREYVKEVRLRKDRNQYSFRIRDNQVSDFSGSPLVLFDGIPVDDINKIVAFDPLKIKKIDVVQKRYFYGNLLQDGIVSFGTYNGDLAGFSLDPSAVVLEYPGLQLQRQFYEPVYETAQQAESRIPDFRNVLYWNPYAGTDVSGKKTLNFYTGDLPGKYAVVIEGITAGGSAASRLIQFEVK